MENPHPSDRSRAAGHAWRFTRTGGFEQVLLETGDDLRILPGLDQKLWTVLSCPAGDLEFDGRTLDLLDTDRDGRIRIPEVRAAVEWACSVLKDPGELVNRGGPLPLDAIDGESPEGKKLLASAKGILRNLGKPESPVITVEDASDTAGIFSKTLFNGDGIVPPEAAGEESLRKTIVDVMECAGSETDRSGVPGVDAGRVERFYSDARAWSDWRQKALDEPGRILPLGDGTAEAAAALEAVKGKVDDYFIRSGLAGFDDRAAGAMNLSLKEYEDLASRDLASAGDRIAVFPIARVEPKRALPLRSGVNPAWTDRLRRFREAAVIPLLGDRDGITGEEWAGMKNRLAPFEEWKSSRKGGAVEKLGPDRIRQLLSDGSREKILELIERDRTLKPEADAVTDVERLVRYRRDLFTFLNNFVTLRDFYTPRGKAIFQAGTLYLDGRSCDLCLRVEDPNRHAPLAALGKTYLAYCECTRDGGKEKMHIAAAFTGGDSDQLMVGRNGIFYDRRGRDWDARITKIVDHPVSIRQAFWSPYKKIARMIAEQLEKIAASREKAVEARAAAGIEAAGKAAPGDRQPVPPFDVGKFAGIFAAIGLAIGAIGTALASIVTGFLKLAWWQIPIGIAAIILVISGPSVVLAWLKLRHRNLGPILDAGGWAVNSRVKINVPFGEALTALPRLPEGSTRRKGDPYAGKGTPWKTILLILVLAAAAFYFWQTGDLARWIGF